MKRIQYHIIYLLVFAASAITYGQEGVLDSLKQTVADSLKLTERKAQLQNLDAPLSLDSVSADSTALSPLDSLTIKVGTVGNKINGLAALPGQKAAQAESKVITAIDIGIDKVAAATVGKATDKVGQVDNKLSGNATGQFNALLGNPADQLNRPEFGLQEQLPEVDGVTSTLDEMKGITNVQQQELSNIKEQLKVDGLIEGVESIKSAPTEQLEKIKATKELQEATQQVGQVKEVRGKAQEYQESVNAAKEGDFSKIEETAENEAKKQVAKIDEVGALQEQSQELEQLKQQQLDYQQQLEQLKEQKVVKDKLKQRAATKGAEFFAQYEDKLNAAQNGYGSYKKKFLKVKGEKWLKLKPNAMKGKPFRERLVIGGYTQVVRLQTVAIDISPIMGYKLSGIFVAGIGGTYRLDLGDNGYSPNFDKPVYGYRTYLDAKVYKGFYLHGEYENMSIELPVAAANAADITNREWVSSALFGIGKHYSIRNKINGYIQGLYNPTFEYNRSPYAKKFMLRIGLEGVLGKREKKSQIDVK